MLLGPLFDSLGRRRMISLTYIVTGIGLALTGGAFMAGWLSAVMLAISIFYAIGAGTGGFIAPVLFAWLIWMGNPIKKCVYPIKTTKIKSFLI